MSCLIEAPRGRLTHLGLLQFSGADALSFLQGQVSNDTRLLAQRTPTLAAYSNAQGRVVALLDLLPHSDGVLAILPRELARPVEERMRRFVLRAKVKIEDLSDRFDILGARDSSALELLGLPAPPASVAYLESEGCAIARLAGPRRVDSERFWVVRPRAARSVLDAAQDDASAVLEWRRADIRAGLPQVYAATSEAFVAQMLNLDLLEAISFSKGCYTGQEIIARTQHLGRIKRRMFRLELPAYRSSIGLTSSAASSADQTSPSHQTWSVGATLRLPDGRSGQLVEVACTGASCEVLAVLTLAGAQDAQQLQAPVAAIELPLPYPL